MFDAATASRLKQWQEEHGLPCTGFLGPLSREVMNAQLVEEAWDEMTRLQLTRVAPRTCGSISAAPLGASKTTGPSCFVAIGDPKRHDRRRAGELGHISGLDFPGGGHIRQHVCGLCRGPALPLQKVR